jgi:hypothetical protein
LQAYKRENKIRERRATWNKYVAATSVSKRWKACAKNSSDTERTEEPREAPDSSERNRRHFE